MSEARLEAMQRVNMARRILADQPVPVRCSLAAPQHALKR